MAPSAVNWDSSSQNGNRHSSTAKGVENGGFHSTTNGNISSMPIAICGMGLRLPGGIRSDADLYKFLINKGDARTETPRDRFNIDAYYDPQGRPGSIITKYGYFIDADMKQFDVSMFGITPAEASQLDFAQRLLLEVVREAFESAGEGDFRGKDIGTFVGGFTEDWGDMRKKDTLDYAPYRLFGRSDFVMANRLAYEYDLKGPSLVIKTACSAAAVAAHDAILAIRAGQCSGAVVCGANLILAPDSGIGLTAQQTLAPDGNCKTFDASADGYARGEAVSALYIKRLDHAIRDGNPIRAVIRASGSNADGGTDGFTTPSAEAQELLIRQTYSNANLSLSDTGVVECHGTGTAVGDPLEVQAVANCFGAKGAYIGSVKPNLGHAEGASGITSLAKAVLELENRILIPNVKFETPNPKIPWREAKLRVPVNPTPWPESLPERISVNSFGIGGSNVHFVLESASSLGLAAPISIPRSLTASTTYPTKSLLLFSANSPEALTDLVEAYDTYISQHPERTESVAYTLGARRERLKLRTFAVADGTSQLKAGPAVPARGVKKVAFVFTGQGAQWIQMGRKLFLEHPRFAKTIRDLDSVLQSLPAPPSWTLEENITTLDDKEILGGAERAQPTCTALQIALVDLLAEFDIYPAAVIGHSGGETAGAYAAGALSPKEALLVAYFRGVICSKAPSGGGMAAVGLGRDAVVPYLAPGVVLACENSGSSVTLSGDLGPLDEVLYAIQRDAPDTFVRKLGVPVAYHSHHMKAVGNEFFSLIEPHIQSKPIKIPFFSSVRAKVVRPGESIFGAEYWQNNLESPVLFHTAAVQLTKEMGPDIAHLEVGPHSALAAPLRQIYRALESSATYASTLSRGVDDSIAFLSTLGQLYCAGLPIDPFSLSEGRSIVPLTDLPTYPWHYAAPLFSETRVMTNWLQREYGQHELLGVRTIENGEIEPVWRNNIHLKNLSWIQDHCVGKDIVFPAAAYFAMAGEAAMQLSENSKSYTLREVNIGAAMVLQEQDSIEVLTTLRKKRLTTTLESKYYEFSISSYLKGAWTQHCWGLVAGGTSAPLSSHTHVEAYSRPVSSKRWYTTMARIGLNYGPRFSGLDEITADSDNWAAALKITDVPDEGGCFYPLHPTTIDKAIQSWTVASVKGEYRLLNRLFLPTFIEELYVGPGTSKTISVHTSASGNRRTARGESHGTVNFDTVFSLRGFKGTPLNDEGLSGNPAADLMVTQLQWTLDIDFARLNRLMKPVSNVTADLALLEKMYIMCALNVRDRLNAATISQPHFEKYRSWLNQQCLPYNANVPGAPSLPIVARPADFTDMSIETRNAQIQQCLEKATDTAIWPAMQVIHICYERNLDIVEGRTELLDLLLPDGLFTQFYNYWTGLSDLSPFFQTLGHNKPQLRILEVGAGTGATTAKVLEALISEYGERLYDSYTITDISSGFFSQCQERFKGYEEIQYHVLDVSQDPVEQGFNPGEYDLIIAANVLHATPVLTESLSACRKLLADDGYLLIQELDPVWEWMGFVFGLFPGWWLGEPDGRPDRPCVAPAEWDRRLREAGFDGVSAVSYDNHQPYQANANMIARPAVSTIQYPAHISFLTASETISPFAENVQQFLQDLGYEVDHYTWGEEAPKGQDVISFLDVDSPEAPLLKDISESDLACLVRTIDEIQSSASTLLWLSPPAQVDCQDPFHGQILGLARSLRTEMGLDIATLELEHLSMQAAQAVPQVMQKVQRSRSLDRIGDRGLDPDMEFAFVAGEIQIPRFHWYSISKALAHDLPPPDAKHLVIGQRGMLQTLQWEGSYFEPLAPDDIELKIAATGMNFLDLAIAMNIVDTADQLGEGWNAMGSEGVGYVTRRGANVTSLEIGDRVVWRGVECHGYATKLQRPAEYCVKVPDSLSNEDAAGFAFPYMTALWSLVDKANLQRGQSVLIHSAAGGVGIAAIELAIWIGAEIFVTVGTPEKKEYLMQRFGLPAERIFNSRDDSFEAGIMQATNGRGVDAVLNSLSGDLLHATWRCVASAGCMLEIGKRDFLGRAQLAMHLFEDNRTFFGIDFSRLGIYNRPAMVRLMKQVMDLYDKGHIHPLHPTTVFEATHVEDAFRFMQKGLHMGRIVVRFPEDDSCLPLSAPVATLKAGSFRHDVSYLLVGGLGGLGRSIISWMVAGGAKHLVVVSRSSGKTAQDRAFIQQVAEAGAVVDCHAGDVADRDFLGSVIQQTQTSGFPIAGVMQMAMVLRDVGFTNMDHASWVAATRPKISGTWVLHDLLPQDQSLDFFVLFSSTAGTLGNYGQANYASANTFLDSFVQYRHRLGLPASVIDISVIGDVGYVSNLNAVEERADKIAGRPLTEQEFLSTLQLAIVRSSSRFATPLGTKPTAYRNQSQVSLYNSNNIPITDPENTLLWKRDPRMAIYRNIEKVSDATGSSAIDSLRRFVGSLTAEPAKLDDPSTVVLFTQEITKKVAAFLMKDESLVDPSESLAAMGVDSLVTIEVRNWWKQTFGTEVSVLELRNGGNLAQLGELAVQRLRDKLANRS